MKYTVFHFFFAFRLFSKMFITFAVKFDVFPVVTWFIVFTKRIYNRKKKIPLKFIFMKCSFNNIQNLHLYCRNTIQLFMRLIVVIKNMTTTTTTTNEEQKSVFLFSHFGSASKHANISTIDFSISENVSRVGTTIFRFVFI